MFELNGWELGGLLARLALYFALITALGGSFSLWLIPDDSRRFLRRTLLSILLAALIGFHAVLLHFLIQVGAINQSGLGGMLDWELISFYLQLPVGDASLLRLTAFLLLLVGQLIALVYISRLQRPPRRRMIHLILGYSLFCMALVIYSIPYTGHMAVQPLSSRLALMLHVTTMSLWLGSLFPLWKLTHESGLSDLQQTLQRFSQLATVIVAVLLAAAAVMVWQLFDSLAELWNTRYGRLLLIKVLAVTLLLELAAFNRWYLVPKLTLPGKSAVLRRSIASEMLLGATILVVTACLSILTGPGDH